MNSIIEIVENKIKQKSQFFNEKNIQISELEKNENGIK